MVKNPSVKFRFAFLFLAVMTLIGLGGCRQGAGEPIRRTEFLMDTAITITVYHPGHQEAVAQAFEEMERIEKLMSAHLPGSDVDRINSAQGSPVQVSQETFQVIEKSLRYGELTGGAFDITVGPLVNLWGITEENKKVPSEAEIEEVLALVDFRGIGLDGDNRTVTLTEPGMRLDLGGVAKGYAVDRAKEVLVEAGVDSALIEAGGDVWAVGKRPDGRRFRIGVRHPRQSQDLIAVIPLEDAAVVSSGDYQRYFIEDGIRYHHIFDPETGYPAATGVVSTTVLGTSAMETDILSTALFILGPEAGLEFVEGMPDTEAIFVLEDLSILATSGLEYEG